MYASIFGMGQWFPETIRENSDWPPEFIQESQRRAGDRTLVEIEADAAADRCRAIAARYIAEEAGDPFLGARQRRIAEPGLPSADAEAHAAQSALKDAKLEAMEVDAILSWALVPDRIMPSNACRVAELLGAKRAWASTVDSACASPISQLLFATSLIESGRARVVLLTQSHLANRTFPMSHPASPSVGDGATALVVSASERPGIQSIFSRTHGEYYDAVLWCRDRNKDQDSPWWESGGPFCMGSHNPAKTRFLIEQTIRFGERTVRELAEQARFNVSEIKVLACVHPRRWVPAAIAEALGLPLNVAPQTYDRYGHLGGAGVIANLIAAREQGLMQQGDRVVLYAQGAGFTRGSVALRW